MAVIIHHLCSVINMFAAKLLTHLFFACMMGQVSALLEAGDHKTILRRANSYSRAFSLVSSYSKPRALERLSA